jgi:hypothetical protein
VVDQAETGDGESLLTQSDALANSRFEQFLHVIALFVTVTSLEPIGLKVKILRPAPMVGEQ